MVRGIKRLTFSIDFQTIYFKFSSVSSASFIQNLTEKHNKIKPFWLALTFVQKCDWKLKQDTEKKINEINIDRRQYFFASLKVWFVSWF